MCLLLSYLEGEQFVYRDASGLYFRHIFFIKHACQVNLRNRFGS